MTHAPAHSPRLSVALLGSGSVGNATVVSFGSTALLVDCGLSARETRRRMQAAGIAEDDLAAIFVTHEHVDHIRGLRVFTSKRRLPVYATRGTARATLLGVDSSLVVPVRACETYRVGELEVTPFGTSHDTAEPVGFVFRATDGTSFGLLTDSGRVTEEAAEHLRGCELLGIETNHDVDMLRNGAYPAFLKRRILSDRGHLSNPDAADALASLATPALRSVAALHVSKFNNTPDLARAALADRLLGEGLTAVNVVVAKQDEPRAMHA